MKKLSFVHAQFIKSALHLSDFPNLRRSSGQEMPEVAIIGKSNVGKSSLINFMFNNRKLAKVSATPGKTQTLNFFTIDEELSLVDLPGYGYSRVSKEIKNQWAECIDNYLETRPGLIGILQLIDVRRMPSEEDLAFIKWCSHHGKPILILFTKSDKINSSEKKKNVEAALRLIKESTGVDPSGHMECSVKDISSRHLLILKINEFLIKAK
jgi:GTP-binding protein